MATKTQLKIQEKAYQIWEAEGRPDDRDQDHWLQAEKEVSGDKPKPKRSLRAKKSA